MKQECIIVLDTGTTSMRAIVFDQRARALASFQSDHPPTYYPDGRVEQPAHSFAATCSRLLSQAHSYLEEHSLTAACISLTSQRSSVIALDSENNVMLPVLMWQDRRAAALCEALQHEEPWIYQRTGLRLSPVFSAPKMLWIAEHQPDLHARASRLMGIQDYLIFLLSGSFTIDRSLASRTLLYNLHSGTWDNDLLALFKVSRSQLCEIIDPGEIAGHVHTDAARITGIPAGTPLIAAGGDQQCAALGLGLLDASHAISNTGTGSYLIALSDQPALDPDRGIFCNVAAIPGRFILEAGLLAAGVAYRWFRDLAFPEDTATGTFECINHAVETSPPGAHGVLSLPYLAGAGAPWWNPQARGMFAGLSLGTSRNDMARAILEGIAADLADNFDRICRLAGHKARVMAAGGLARFAEFRQIQADMLGVPVEYGERSEATALGAWISAAVRLGWYGTFEEAWRALRHDQATSLSMPRDRVRDLYRSLRRERIAMAIDHHVARQHER